MLIYTATHTIIIIIIYKLIINDTSTITLRWYVKHVKKKLKIQQLSYMNKIMNCLIIIIMGVAELATTATNWLPRLPTGYHGHQLVLLSFLSFLPPSAGIVADFLLGPTHKQATQSLIIKIVKARPPSLTVSLSKSMAHHFFFSS